MYIYMYIHVYIYIYLYIYECTYIHISIHKHIPSFVWLVIWVPNISTELKSFSNVCHEHVIRGLYALGSSARVRHPLASKKLFVRVAYYWNDWSRVAYDFLRKSCAFQTRVAYTFGIHLPEFLANEWHSCPTRIRSSDMELRISSGEK